MTTPLHFTIETTTERATIQEKNNETLQRQHCICLRGQNERTRPTYLSSTKQTNKRKSHAQQLLKTHEGNQTRQETRKQQQQKEKKRKRRNKGRPAERKATHIVYQNTHTHPVRHTSDRDSKQSPPPPRLCPLYVPPERKHTQPIHNSTRSAKPLLYPRQSPPNNTQAECGRHLEPPTP